MTGFIRATHASKELGLQIIRRVDMPPTCAAIELLDLPEPNSSPLMGSTVFKFTPDVMYNDHFSWSNGVESMFFIKHAHGSRGNWLIGSVAGEDSGYVFMEAPQYSKTPLGLESDENSWKWLLANSWVDQPQMTVRCLDNALITHFYEVEYFSDQHAVKSFMYLNSDASGFMLEPHSQLWTFLSDIQPVLALGQPVNIGQDIATLVNFEHATVPGWRVTLRAQTKDPLEHREHSLTLLASGFIQADGVSALSNTQKVLNERRVVSDIRSAQPGDYVWLWYHTASTVGHPIASRAELLVQCVNNFQDTIVFKYFPTNRIDTMGQSILAQNTDMLVVSILSNDRLEAALARQQVDILNTIFIGPRLEEFVWNYIHYKEKALPAVSACFMYHAAVSMPQVLVYAAEIVCMIAGGKPVVLVQYTTSSDHQWKFPLVQKLTRGIVAAKAANEVWEVDYMVFRHDTQETLVLYRSNRRYLVDLLRPFHEAQALHLLPTVDDQDDPVPTWRDQVYNAAWNGHVLGYPSHFISSYCEDFPNDLSVGEKQEIFLQAKDDFADFMRQEGHQVISIKLGTDQPVDRKAVFGSV